MRRFGLVCMLSSLFPAASQQGLDKEKLSQAFASVPPQMLGSISEIQAHINSLPIEKRLDAMNEITDRMGYNKPCGNPVRCKAGEERVQREIKFEAVDKCLPFSGMYDMVVGMSKKEGHENVKESFKDGASIEPFTKCCRQLLGCLESCGKPEQSCRMRFKQCSNGVCAETVDPSDAKAASLCENHVALLLDGIKMNKCDAYKKAQRANCVCVPSEKAPEARTQALRDFYQKYDPENIFKVEELMVDSTTPKKFSDLVSKLAISYPMSISDVASEELCQAPKEEREDTSKADVPPAAA